MLHIIYLHLLSVKRKGKTGVLRPKTVVIMDKNAMFWWFNTVKLNNMNFLRKKISFSP